MSIESDEAILKKNVEAVLEGVNEVYAELKMVQAGRKVEDLSYMAPELRPQISSTQVKALVEYLVRRGVL